jgi:uncharacterized membrane protein
MAQAAKQKKTARKTAAQQPQLLKSPNWPVFALAVIGMILSAYLTYSAWQEQTVAFCTAGSGCDVVLSSRWSTLFGLPVSLWGFFAYAGIALAAWNHRADVRWKMAWVISLFGVLYSLYLTSISIFVLDATCPYCLTSLGLMAAIFITVTLQRPADLPRFSWGPWAAKTVGSGLVVVLLLHLYYSGYWGQAPRQEDPWVRSLAEHLAKSDVKFYGTYWCPHCNDQKALFGASAKRLPYIECSPGGQSAPQAAECKQKGIQSYPTWIINGQRYSGTQSLDALAQYSKFNYQGGNP